MLISNDSQPRDKKQKRKKKEETELCQPSLRMQRKKVRKKEEGKRMLGTVLIQAFP
jgi:hypothetical protein